MSAFSSFISCSPVYMFLLELSYKLVIWKWVIAISTTERGSNFSRFCRDFNKEYNTTPTGVYIYFKLKISSYQKEILITGFKEKWEALSFNQANHSPHLIIEVNFK